MEINRAKKSDCPYCGSGNCGLTLSSFLNTKPKRMQQTKHWADALEPGDTCLATIRHETDGSKNLVNIEVIIIDNDRAIKKIEAWFKPGFKATIPYNELKQFNNGK